MGSDDVVKEWAKNVRVQDLHQKIAAEKFANQDANITSSKSGSKLGEIEHMGDMTLAQKAIFEVCNEIREILLDKNRKYGNSALEPVRVFSDSPPDEQIRVRIDDKISRLRSGQVDEDEDVLLDLIGYITLLIVYRRTMGSQPRKNEETIAEHMEREGWTKDMIGHAMDARYKGYDC